MACSSSRSETTGMPVISNSAEISARGLPSRMTPLSARSPKSSPKASIRIDLPAPVSPVRTVMPRSNSSSSSSMTAKSRMFSRLIKVGRMYKPDLIGFFSHYHAVAGHQFTFDFTVAGQSGIVDFRGADNHFNGVVTGDDDGPVAEGVRADRDQHQGVQFRVQYRAATGQGVSR